MKVHIGVIVIFARDIIIPNIQIKKQFHATEIFINNRFHNTIFKVFSFYNYLYMPIRNIYKS